MVCKATILLACTLAFAFPLVAASPLGADTHVVTREAPGRGFQFVPADLVVDVAGTLTLTNADLVAHDVVAVEDGPGTNAWCGRFVTRACPLFASAIVGLGGRSAVDGIEALPASDASGVFTYEYYCSIHPWMTGTITTV